MHPAAAERAELIAAVRRAIERVPEIRVAYLFGSRDRGTARADSDLDVAVAFARDATPQACAEAKLALIDELTGQLGRIGEGADVVDLRTANSDVAFRVIRDGTLVFERDSRERVNLVVSIGRRYDDDAGKRALFVAAAQAAARRMASSDG